MFFGSPLFSRRALAAFTLVRVVPQDGRSFGAEAARADGGGLRGVRGVADLRGVAGMPASTKAITDQADSPAARSLACCRSQAARKLAALGKYATPCCFAVTLFDWMLLNPVTHHVPQKLLWCICFKSERVGVRLRNTISSID